MTTYAVLAEKPDMARKIVAGLGGKATNHKDKGYFEVTGSPALDGRILVTFGFGHLIRLVDPDAYNPAWKKWNMDQLPMVPTKFKTEPAAKTKKQFNNVKAVFAEANSIIIATDADREGENIAYEIIDEAGERDKVTKRLWINSNLPAAVAEGFRNLKDAADTYSYYKESHARSLADWLVGMNFSRLFTLKAQTAGIQGQAFSAGRVQTPVLALVCKNYLERKNFKPVPYFMLDAETEREGQKVVFKNATKYDAEIDVQAAMAANKLQNPFKGTVAKVTKEHKRTTAPQLFDLAGIQSFANKNWHYTNDQTLDLVQSLYDQQYVTYPRTEETKISAEEFNLLLQDAPVLLSVLGIQVDITNATVRSKYVGEYSAHSALMPTTKHPALTELPEAERNVYGAIAKRTLMMFAPDYEFDHTEVLIPAGNLEFKVTGNVPTNVGWKTIQKDDQDQGDDDSNKQLPAFTEGEDVYLTFNTKPFETKPPKPYTPASLGGKNSAMEKLNLGTPATRASIIKTNVDRDYMRLSKNNYVPTEKGLLMYDLVKKSSLGSPEMTAAWEERLHNIEVQKEQPEQFLAGIKTFVAEETAKEKDATVDSTLAAQTAAKSSFGECPICHKGQVQKRAKGFFCSNPECKFVIWAEIAHKRLSDTNVKELLVDGRTKKKVTGLKGRNGAFDAFITLSNQGKTGFAFK